MCGNVAAKREATCLLLADRRVTYGRTDPHYADHLDGPTMARLK